MQQPSAESGIKWVFFDVGNVIYHDLAQSFRGYHWVWRSIHEQHPEVTFEDLLRDREQRIEKGEDWISYRIARAYLDEATTSEIFDDLREHLLANFDANHVFHNGMRELIAELRGKVKLGILANQPPECRSSLERRGVLDSFEIVGISEELELYKPDPQLYSWGVEQAGISPEKCVMIGDRLDNDVVPAQSVGMKAIWLRWDSSADETRPVDEPEYEQFLESCRRRPLFEKPDEKIRPDATVANSQELLEVLSGWVDTGT